jgi:uncharacterized repeat protein (TIGR03803 family)
MVKLSIPTLITLVWVSLSVVGVTPSAHAQAYALYDFDFTHGADPSVSGLLAQGPDGNLYGTAPMGGTSTNCGASGCGVAFGISPTGYLGALYDFVGGIHGATPYSGLTVGTDGSFYGATYVGGTDNLGTIFRSTPGGHGTILHSFTGADGEWPGAPPIQGADGNFYGATPNQGDQGNSGSIYKITSSGTFTLLGILPGDSTAPLLEATDGNFYGTTFDGGDSSCASGCGTVFRVTPDGQVTVVHYFEGSDGAAPDAPLIQGNDGSLYGTTSTGGLYGNVSGDGVIFQITPQGSFAVLHNFGDPNYPQDGVAPRAGLVQATDGNFYGVTSEGGEQSGGVIFQIAAGGSYAILYNFDYLNGSNPFSTPMQHTNGNIYGLTASGGLGWGVLYGFDVHASPFVRMVSSSGKVDETGGILGQGLTGTANVSLNGTPATFTVVSDTFIKATVPAGATTGYVTVTTPTGVLTSNVPFHVIP